MYKKNNMQLASTMEIKKLDKTEVSEFRDLVAIFKDVFENKEELPPAEHLGRLLANPFFVVFVVKINGKVAGGLTLYVLSSYYSIKPIAYIYDVGISKGYQRQGLGKALMAGVIAFCKHNDFAEAYVEAESDDIGAVGFYRKAALAHEMNAIHFTYTFADSKQN